MDAGKGGQMNVRTDELVGWVDGRSRVLLLSVVPSHSGIKRYKKSLFK